MEVAKLNLGGMNQQILYHKSDFMHFFEINVESLHLVPNTCLVSVQILDLMFIYWTFLLFIYLTH